MLGFLGGSDGKESACNVGDLGLIPGLRRSPVGGHGNPLQYSCLENPMNRGAWWATVHGVTKSQTRLNDMTISSQGQKLRHCGGICFSSPALAGENFTEALFFLTSLAFVYKSPIVVQVCMTIPEENQKTVVT